MPRIDEAAIMAVLETVPDPEIPVLTITDLGIVRGIAIDPPRVLISPTYTGCPATHGDRSFNPRGARRGRFRRCRASSACSSRPGRPTGLPSAAASGCMLMESRRRLRRPRPNARVADRLTRSRSAGSDQRRARRSGAATAASSRSTGSSATERPDAHHSAKLPSDVLKIGLRQRCRSLSASRTAASSISTPSPGPSGTGR